MLELQPGFHRPHQLLGMVHLQQGLCTEAVAELQQALVLSAGNRKLRALLALAKAVCGRREDAEQIAAELNAGERPYVSAVDMALVYSALGDHDRLFEWLGKAYAAHDGELIWLGIDPIYDSLRSDSRFRHLLERMRLTPALPA